MLLDARSGDRAALDRDFDVCVIGTGPAGMTVARRLAARGASVALLEGGGLDLEAESQALYAGELAGLDYYPLEDARLRMFGGSSMHWGGRCRPLDAGDFQARAHVPLSGWPIAKADLDPYQAEADTILDLAGPAPPDLPMAQDRPRFRHIRYRFSPPTRFGDKYRDEIAASRGISCAVGANLVDLRLDDDLATVAEARLRSFAPGDPGFAVRARAFVLALGGLENPRALLNCTSQIPVGIGNQNDMVGRFFCEHPHLMLGEAFFAAPLSEAALRASAEPVFAPTEAFLEQHRILDFALYLHPVVEPPLGFGTEALRSLQCATPFAARLSRAVLGHAVNCDRGGLGMYFAQDGGRQVVQAHLGVHAEQSLQRDSRVMLADEADPFGLRRIRLDWRLGALDYHTFATAVTEFGVHFAERGLGRVHIANWLRTDPPHVPGLNQGSRIGGHHHMCATRMSADPREGVVDPDCRVHGTANLYVGGSSAFATTGFANPTYTIVQLALRLGDHLADRLRA